MDRLLYMAVMPLVNRLRGSTCRVCAGILTAGFTTLFLDGPEWVKLVDGLALLAAYFLWAIPGWGLYFAALTGRWNPAEKEISFIDEAGLWLVPFVGETDAQSNQARGAFCMFLRMLFAAPFFAYIGGRVDAPVPAALATIIGFAAAAALSYRYSDTTEQAEYYTGAWFATAVQIILLGGIASLSSLV